MPCGWCGQRTPGDVELSSSRTQFRYLFCSESCKQAFVRESEDYSGD